MTHHERLYFDPHYAAILSCEERAMLTRLGNLIAEGLFGADDTPPIDPKRLAFARYLVETGRVSDWPGERQRN